MSFFRHEPVQDASGIEAAPLLTGDDTVAAWLSHPTGGVVFRAVLQEAGQNESVLQIVHKVSLNRLVKMSRGQFTQQMLDSMIAKANHAETEEVIQEAVVADETTVEPKKAAGRFRGQTIIVTDAGSGIGRATASRIAREGGRVIAVDDSAKRLATLQEELSEMDMTIIVGDSSHDDTVQKIIDAVSAD